MLLQSGASESKEWHRMQTKLPREQYVAARQRIRRETAHHLLLEKTGMGKKRWSRIGYPSIQYHPLIQGVSVQRYSQNERSPTHESIERMNIVIRCLLLLGGHIPQVSSQQIALRWWVVVCSSLQPFRPSGCFPIFRVPSLPSHEPQRIEFSMSSAVPHIRFSKHRRRLLRRRQLPPSAQM